MVIKSEEPIVGTSMNTVVSFKYRIGHVKVGWLKFDTVKLPNCWLKVFLYIVIYPKPDSSGILLKDPARSDHIRE